MGTVEPRERGRMRMFEEAHRDWKGGCLTQDQPVLLGMSTQTFRC